MPSGDGTGPMGMGSMTGRAAGYCAGYANPGYRNAGGRRGRGGVWGRRRGFGGGRFGWAPMGAGYPTYGGGPAPPTREQELETLKQQATDFQGALTNIQKRIEQLAADAPSK